MLHRGHPIGAAVKLLDDYTRAREAVFAHFGYKEDWRAFPVEDNTGMSWMLLENQVAWGDLTPEGIKTGQEFCSAIIYTYRHLSQHVWRAAEATMVLADTRTDGNIFLMVFDNQLEITDEALKKLYKEYW